RDRRPRRTRGRRSARSPQRPAPFLLDLRCEGSGGIAGARSGPGLRRERERGRGTGTLTGAPRTPPPRTPPPRTPPATNAPTRSLPAVPPPGWRGDVGQPPGWKGRGGGAPPPTPAVLGLKGRGLPRPRPQFRGRGAGVGGRLRRSSFHRHPLPPAQHLELHGLVLTVAAQDLPEVRRVLDLAAAHALDHIARAQVERRVVVHARDEHALARAEVLAEVGAQVGEADPEAVLRAEREHGPI